MPSRPTAAVGRTEESTGAAHSCDHGHDADRDYDRDDLERAQRHPCRQVTPGPPRRTQTRPPRTYLDPYEAVCSTAVSNVVSEEGGAANPPGIPFCIAGMSVPSRNFSQLSFES